MNVFVCKTLWEIYVSLLVSLRDYNESDKKSIFIIEETYENSSKINQLSKANHIEQVIPFKLNQNKIIKGLLFWYRIKASLHRKLKSFLDTEYDIKLFIDQGVFGQYFIKHNKEVDLYEHGNGNYVVGAYPNYKFVKKLLGITEGYGRHEKVKRVFLTDVEKAPVDIKHKALELDIDGHYTLLSESDKFFINNLFNIPEIKSNNILLTQPLSEDNVCSENEKVDIYKSIINKYHGDVVIKPHPREITDYNIHFPEIEIINNDFPFEIMNYSSKKFKKAITLFSSAVYHINYPIEIHFIGTEKYPKVKQRFGKFEEEIRINNPQK